MSYSPFVGPALFLVLFLPAIFAALKKPRGEGPLVKRSTLWMMAVASIFVAAGQAALNFWIPWAGDGLLAAGVVVLLLATRTK